MGANWWYLAVAVLLYALSKVISSFRLNMYFRNMNLILSQKENLRLYWLGMFYNLFLPGAIGGDAYKVLVLNKKKNAPLKPTSIAILLDRLSGLLGLTVIFAVFGLFVLDESWMHFILAGGTVVGAALFYIVVFYFFNQFIKSFVPTFFWGVLVQATQVICVYFLLLSLGAPLSSQWIFIFLLASIITVFPVSMGGGLGARELVFSEGAHYFHLDAELGVTISLLFFLCNFSSCIWGAYFIFREPLRARVDAGDVALTANKKGS
jgi:uncharacterized membrane protein YbhN (UPF0104 family)